ncbi:HEAT repeat domain-containing protein [Zobellia alginiliquefaciens]|uniref:HEAT repeat domain-containing protein n=1 Tax=Zobellia alginiliquefaciens TaxID=3032586 RepID=UPI0023E3B482|nr:HEAT repeat domain-containing protein [Zobellia alginiliquefaciens]
MAFITPPKVNTDILWGLSIVFVVLAVVYFISVFFFRNKISATAARTKKRKKELSPMISEFLFYEEDADKGEKSNYISLKIEIRELLKDHFNRKVLVEVLLDLRKDVSGDTQIRLFKLYQDLGLQKDAFKKLKSWRWEVISKGILELTQMQVVTAYGFITKFINHKTATIRKQAEIATVTLKPEGINYFLDTTRYKISEWQQLKLLDVLRNQENYEPPRFRMWLTSKNKHVVLFALRLIKYYNQNDANSSLIELVKHKNYQIREEAIGCIKEFYVVEAIPTLKAIFKKCNTDGKIAVLGAISELGSVDDIDFLKNVAKKENNFSVSSKALAAINTISPETVMPSEGLEKPKAYIAETEESDALEHIDAENPLSVIPEDEIVILPVAEKNQEEERGQEELPEVDTVITDSTIDQTAIDSIEICPPDTKEDSEVHEVSFKELMVPEEKYRPNKNEDPIEFVQITEILVVDPVIVTGFLSKTENIQIENFSDPSLQLDFLPVVIDNPVYPNQPTIKYRPMADSENNNLDVRCIEVEYEEVASDTQPEGLPKQSIFDIAKIDFLPIVIDDQELKFDEVDTKKDVNSKDTSADKDYEELQELIDEVNELNFLPIVMDSEVVEEQDLSEVSLEGGMSESANSLDGFTLSDFEIDFENAEEVLPLQNEEMCGETVNSDFPEPEVNEAEDVMTWLMGENELRDIELEYEVVSSKELSNPLLDLIPEPIYYNEHEAYMMGLLDDLEEMGDHREIPLLQELLAEETESFVKDRINSLIEQFSYLETTLKKVIGKPQQQADEELPVFSVFADLFKNIDTESKLILLNEVVSVGDEKEIDFLDGLLEDPNPKIRKKAQEALKLLVEKVSRKTEFEKDLLPRPLEALPIDLSILEPFTVSTSKKATYVPKKHGNKYDREEVVDFDFELDDTQVLDKKYDQKTLNIDVKAIDVSPNEGSFLNTIIDFPRKFIGKLNG